MSHIETLYGNISEIFFNKLSNIKLLVCDVDGVFSDGQIIMGNQGEEFKAFHALDGYGVKAVQKIGIRVAVITGRESSIVQQRMSSLGIEHIIQGCEDKNMALRQLAQTLELEASSIASVGDDMPDIGMFECSSIAFSVENGHQLVKQKADYVTRNTGGHGAVREICDLLLQSHSALNVIHGPSL
jgi:3-deoxy-D-manno-octulosonate 8-phosphate phosphatase (KDO 8-P phosphatase)